MDRSAGGSAARQEASPQTILASLGVSETWAASKMSTKEGRVTNLRKGR